MPDKNSLPAKNSLKILVIGGAGYIGSVVVELLINAGHEVVVFDNLITGHKEAVHEKAVFVQGDLGSEGDLDATMSKYPIDAVMHFAALSQVGESIEQPARYFTNNVAYGFRLLDTMIKHGLNKIVFSSSAAVYGTQQKMPITEDASLIPINPYGDTKLTFERALKWYGQSYGIKYACLRYFNACGATERYGEDHAHESHLIPLVLQVPLGRSSIVKIFGEDYPTQDGTCIRDYIHILDIADAHIKVLHALDQESRSHIYNLGNGLGYSVKEIIAAARKVTGHPIPTQVSERRKTDPPILVASSALIQNELAWTPKHPSLEEIIGDAWRWHQKHPTGYKKEKVSV